MNSDRAREVISLSILALGLYLVAALATFEERIVPGQELAMGSLCGPVGSYLASFLLHRFGFAAYIPALLLFYYGIAVFRRRDPLELVHRLPGIVLFMVVVAASLSHILPGFTRSIPDPGGEVGMALSGLIDSSGLGSLGARLTLIVLLLTTFVLASGVLYSRAFVTAFGWVQQGGSLAAVLPFTMAHKQRSKARRRAAPSARKSTAAREADDEEVDEEFLETDEDGDEADADTDAVELDGDEAAGTEGSTDEWDEHWEEDWEAGEDDAEEDEGEEDEGEEDELPWSLDADGAEDDAEEDDTSLDADREFEEEDADEEPPLVVHRSGAGESVSAAVPRGTGEAAPAPRDADQPYQFPSLELLAEVKPLDQEDFDRSTADVARKLATVLQSFRIDARVVAVQRGPSITMYEVELAAGTKLGKLRALEDDLAMNLAAKSVRIVAPIPGKPTAGIEVPNEQREPVGLRELIASPRFDQKKYAIPMFFGKDAAGHVLIADLAEMPHVLVAGSTGAGKSVCLNTMIMSILFTRGPEQVKMILIDPKMVELSSFQNVPHLMCPVVTDMKRAAAILEWAVEKMEARYQLLHEVGVRNIYAFNKLGADEVRERLESDRDDVEATLPFIVIVIDELADLMMTCAKDVEQSITRLAQKSRAVGIHVILATQRPSTNVITGLIKANLPTRIAFRVASKIDSRVILDANGADKLLGAGDMLYLPPRCSDLIRVQGTFVSDKEIRDVVNEVARHSQPSYSKELMQQRSRTDKDPSEVDELFDDAAQYIVDTRRGSASLLQRRYKIGYTRASRLIDLMNTEGILGDYKGSQAREVLLSMEELLQMRTERLKEAGKTAESSAAEEQA